MMKNIQRRDRGFTSMELIAVIGMLATLSGAVFVLYTVAHFVAKYW